MSESADLAVFISHRLLRGSIQTLKRAPRLLNVEHVCEVESQLGVWGCKGMTSCCFNCSNVCVWMSQLFVKRRERSQKGPQAR